MLAKNDYKLLGDLVDVRVRSGLTQADVAVRLGITQQAVSKIESYDGDPRLSTLRRYAHAVGALVAHHVEADVGQLQSPDGWLTVTFSTSKPAPSRTYQVSAKADFAMAA